MANFQSAASEFSDRGTRLIAASADKRDDARGTIDRLGLTFPIACELDAINVATRTGAFHSREKRFLHPTGFMLDPDGQVEEAVYSTGPIGRFTSKDCLTLRQVEDEKEFVNDGRYAVTLIGPMSSTSSVDFWRSGRSRLRSRFADSVSRMYSRAAMEFFSNR